MSLIYLLSSLPMLSLDATPGISPEAFVAACREQLSDKDAAAAKALLRGETSCHPFVLAWRDKDTLLRNAVARARAKRSGKDASRWLRATHGCDLQIDDAVEDAFQETDPLKRERVLDRLRWTLIEEVQGYDPLSVRVVFAYALKLALAARWVSLDKAHGQDTFNQLAELQPQETAQR